MTEHDEEIIRARSVYGGPHGIAELADWLEQLGFFAFTDPTDVAECERLNVARQLLFNKLGIDVHTKQGREDFVSKILELPPKLEQP